MAYQEVARRERVTGIEPAFSAWEARYQPPKNPDFIGVSPFGSQPHSHAWRGVPSKTLPVIVFSDANNDHPSSRKARLA